MPPTGCRRWLFAFIAAQGAAFCPQRTQRTQRTQNRARSVRGLALDLSHRQLASLRATCLVPKLPAGLEPVHAAARSPMCRAAAHRGFLASTPGERCASHVGLKKTAACRNKGIQRLTLSVHGKRSDPVMVHPLRRASSLPRTLAVAAALLCDLRVLCGQECSLTRNPNPQ